MNPGISALSFVLLQGVFRQAGGLIYVFLLLSCGIRLLMFQPCLDQILICLIRSLIYYSCNTSKADLTHMFWSCTKLRQFWFSIFEILNTAFNLGIQPNPIMALFGVTGDDIHITKDKENALAFATLIARRRILLEWKSPIPPKLSLWLSDVIFFLKTEKSHILSEDQPEHFTKHGIL